MPGLLRVLRGHPSEAVLARYHAQHADGAGMPTRARLERHLARCAECRAWLRWRDELGRAACTLVGVPVAARPAVLSGALRRRNAGERVLVPAEPLRSRSTPPRYARFGNADAAHHATHSRGNAPNRLVVIAVATAASVAFAATFLVHPVRSAAAGSVTGELTLAPRTPRLGDTIAVHYRPSALLAGAPQLRLRATFHPDNDTRPWSRPGVTAAWLTPAPDGAYEGRIVLPPGTAYARFAVENTAAQEVDAHGGQPWDVVLADAAGRPRIAGIRSQGLAGDPAAWERTRALVLDATRLYPEHPSGWWLRTQQDVELVGSARAESVAVASRPLVLRLDTALSRAAERESWAMLDLGAFAEFAALPTVQYRWHARLLRDAPHSVAAYSLRMTALWTAKAPPAVQLDSLERWWAADGDSLSLFLSQAVGLAMAAHDTAAARRWAARVVGTDPVASIFVAQQLVRDPALAAAGVGYARADITRLAASDAERPLDATAAEWARERARRTRAARAVVGEGLLALGRPREAAIALSQATAEGWNADAFRALGEALLATGDTTGSLGAFATAVADPILGQRLTQPLRVRFGARVHDATWTRAVAAARHLMHARVLRETVSEPLPGDPRLGDAKRRRRRLSDVVAGQVAVVAMVNRHCGPSLADLPAVAELRAGLASQPVRFVAITDEAPSAAVEQDLRARGLTAPLWYDLDGEAAAMLDAHGTPTYLVLDRAGTVRWRGHSIRDASPILDALLAQAIGT